MQENTTKYLPAISFNERFSDHHGGYQECDTIEEARSLIEKDLVYIKMDKDAESAGIWDENGNEIERVWTK